MRFKEGERGSKGCSFDEGIPRSGPKGLQGDSSADPKGEEVPSQVEGQVPRMGDTLAENKSD